MEKLERLIQDIIANTVKKNSRRELDILSIAGMIEEARQITGTLKEVAEQVGLSEIMLKKFLAALKLDPAIQDLIRKRELDKVQIIYTMKGLPLDEQKFIASKVISGKLNTQDIKVLVPLRNKLSNEKIENVLDKLLKSKNIKVYKANILLHARRGNSEDYNKKISKYFSETDIHDVTCGSNFLEVYFTKEGLQKLKQLASADGTSIKEFLNNLVNG